MNASDSIPATEEVGWAEAGFLALSAALGLLLRAPDAVLFPQFVAEDGTAFFADQLDRSFPQLFEVVQGYWVFLDRLIAWVGSLFPVAAAPMVYNVLAIALAGCSIAWFSLRAREFFHPVASFGALLLIPIINIYVLDNVVHLQWWTQFPLIAVSLLPRLLPAGTSGMRRGIECACIVIIAFTGPFAILCLFTYAMLASAFAIARVARLGAIHQRIGEYMRSLDPIGVAVTGSAGCIVLALAVAKHKVAAPFTHQQFSAFFDIVLGEGLQIHAMGPVLFSRATFLGVQCALLATAIFVPRNARTRIACLMLLAYGFACILAGYAKVTALGVAPAAFNFGDTYFLALAVIEWLVLSSVLGTLVFGSRLMGATVVLTALCALTIRHPYWHVRTDVPNLGWPDYARQIAAGEAVDVPLLPSADWHVRIAGRPKRNGDPPGLTR